MVEQDDNVALEVAAGVVLDASLHGVVARLNGWNHDRQWGMVLHVEGRDLVIWGLDDNIIVALAHLKGITELILIPFRRQRLEAPIKRTWDEICASLSRTWDVLRLTLDTAWDTPPSITMADLLQRIDIASDTEREHKRARLEALTTLGVQEEVGTNVGELVAEEEWSQLQDIVNAAHCTQNIDTFIETSAQAADAYRLLLGYYGERLFDEQVARRPNLYELRAIYIGTLKEFSTLLYQIESDSKVKGLATLFTPCRQGTSDVEVMSWSLAYQYPADPEPKLVGMVEAWDMSHNLIEVRFQTHPSSTRGISRLYFDEIISRGGLRVERNQNLQTTTEWAAEARLTLAITAPRLEITPQEFASILRSSLLMRPIYEPCKLENGTLLAGKIREYYSPGGILDLVIEAEVHYPPAEGQAWWLAVSELVRQPCISFTLTPAGAGGSMLRVEWSEGIPLSSYRQRLLTQLADSIPSLTPYLDQIAPAYPLFFPTDELPSTLLYEYQRKTELSGKASERRAGISTSEQPREELSADQEAVSHETVSTASDHNILRKTGSAWAIAFRGIEHPYPAWIGFDYLAFLLRRPNVQVDVKELIAAISDNDSGVLGSVDIEELREGYHPDDCYDDDAILDDQAKADYKARLLAIKKDRAEAQEDGNEARKYELDREAELIEKELRVNTGLSGRSRKFAGPRESARLSVRRAILRALKEIKRQSPPLYNHLHRTVKTGTKCSYEPGSDSPITWE